MGSNSFVNVFSADKAHKGCGLLYFVSNSCVRYNKTTEIPIWCTRISIPLPESPNRQALSRYARHEVQPVYKVSEPTCTSRELSTGGGGGWVKHVYTVSKPTCRRLLARGMACLYSFKDSIHLWCSLFIKFPNLPTRYCPPEVPLIYTVSEPTSRVL